MSLNDSHFSNSTIVVQNGKIIYDLKDYSENAQELDYISYFRVFHLVVSTIWALTRTLWLAGLWKFLFGNHIFFSFKMI